MDKNFSLRRMKRLFKLTGEYDWISKYAEEAPKGPSGYTVPTIQQFLSTYVSANAVDINGSSKQAILGKVVSEEIADWYLTRLDLKEPALKTIKFEEDVDLALNSLLVDLADEDKAKLRKLSKMAIARLGDRDLAAYASKLSESQLDNLIKFTLTRGYIQCYLQFIFANPIVSIMNGAKPPKASRKAFPLTFDRFVKSAISPAEQYQQEIAKVVQEKGLDKDDLLDVVREVENLLEGFSDEQKLYRRLEKYLPGEDRMQTAYQLYRLYDDWQESLEAEEFQEREEEAQRSLRGKDKYVSKFLETEKTGLRLSHALKVMKVLRMRKMASLEQNPESSQLRMEYLSADAIVKYLGNIQKAVKGYIAQSPAHKTHMWMGQPVAGLDGEGDIIIGTVDDLQDLSKMGLNDLLDVTEWAIDYRLDWVDVDGNPLYFSTGRESEGRKVPLTGKGEPMQTIGKPIPTSKNMLNLYVMDKYKDAKNPDGSVMPGKEASKKEMLESIHEDVPLMIEIKKADVEAGLAPANLKTFLRYNVLAPEMAEEELDASAKIIYSLFLDTLAQVHQTLDVDSFAKTGAQEVTNAISAVLPERVKLRDGWSMAINNAVKEIYEHLGFVHSPSSAADTFNADYAFMLLTSQQQPETVNRKLKDLYKKLPLENEQKKALAQEINDEISTIVSQLDEKLNYRGEGSRTSKPYYDAIVNEKSANSLVNKLRQKYPDLARLDGKPIKKLVQFLGDKSYPDAVRKSGGDDTYHQFWSGTGNPYLQEKLVLSNPSYKGLNKRLEAQLSSVPELKQNLDAFIEANIRPMQPNEELANALKGALDNKTYMDLLNAMASASFNKRAAQDIQTLMGSPYFKSENERWKDNYADSLAKAGKSGRTQQEEQHSEQVKDYYERLSAYLSERPDEVVDFPRGVLYFRKVRDRGSIISKEDSDELIKELSAWMMSYRGSPGNPHGKVKDMMKQIFPDEPFNPAMAHGLYSYIGEVIFDLLASQRWSSQKNKYDLNTLEYYVWSKFKNPRSRGISGEEKLAIADAEAEAAEQASNFINEMRATRFTAVHTRRNRYESELLRTKGIEHKRPVVALDTHGIGGIIQQMMGYSLSEGIEKNLSNPGAFIKWFGVNCAESFGHNINLGVYRTMGGLWTEKRDEYSGVLIRGPLWEDKWHFMEDSGAYADPLWAIKPFTKALKALEVGKRARGWILNNPDTANNHFSRISRYVQTLDETEVLGQFREAFGKRTNEIMSTPEFQNVDPGLFDRYLIIKYSREDHVRTNSPFNLPVEEMARIFDSLNVSIEDLERLVDNEERKQNREEAAGIIEPSHMPQEETMDDVAEASSVMREELMGMQSKMAFSLDEAEAFLMDIVRESRDMGMDSFMLEKVEACAEAAIQALRSLDEKNLAAVFETQNSWVESAQALITNLPSTHDYAKPVFMSHLRLSKAETLTYQTKVEQYTEYQQQTAVAEESVEAIEDVEEEQERQMQEGDIEGAEELEETKDEMVEQAPEAVQQEVQQVQPEVPQQPLPGAVEPEQPEQTQEDWEKMLQEEGFGEVKPQFFGEEEQEDLTGTWRPPDDDENDRFSSLVFRSKPSPKTQGKDIWEDEDRIFFS